MWLCSKCSESVEDSFDACWNCGTSKNGVEVPVFGAADGLERDVSCLRCDEKLEHVGTKRFHEGTNWGVLGEIGEMFVKRERFDVYVCPRCGRVEFFVDGVGEAGGPE